MWFQILQMTNLVRILAPKFCDPFQSGCEMWAIATFSSRTVKDLSCHITEIQETMLEDPPKMFNINSIPKPLLWDSCGDKSFSLKPPGAVSDNGDGLLLRSATVSPFLLLTGSHWHHDWVFTSLSVWTLAICMSDSGLYRRKPPWCHEDMMGSPCHTPLYKEIYVFVDSGC